MRMISTLLVSFLSFAPVAMADPASPSPAMKIGYVDMQSALTLTNQGKREQVRLKKESEEKQQKLDKLQNELKTMKDDFDKQSSMLKEDARMRKQQELQQKYGELQQIYGAAQKEMADKGNQVTQEIFLRARTIIDKIGDRDGYTVILDRNEANVLYFKRNMDITDELVRSYNDQYK